MAVNRIALLSFDGAEAVDRFTNDIEHAAKRSLANGNGYRAPSVNSFHSANHAVGGEHRNSAHSPLAEMLLDFAHDVDRGGHVEAFRDHTQSRVDRRQVTPFKFDVHYWANDLHYPAIHMTVRTASVSVRRSHTFANSSINSSLLKAKSRVG